MTRLTNSSEGMLVSHSETVAVRASGGEIVMRPASKIPLLSGAEWEVIQKAWDFSSPHFVGLWLLLDMLIYSGYQQE